MSKCPYSYFEYTVQHGETFADLAERFSVREDTLRSANNSKAMAPGRRVRVPCRLGGCGCGAFYTLKKKDTLHGVAKKNGISLETLLAANPYLNPAFYIAGQVIVIPQRRRQNVVTQYTLRSGEGVFDVLRKFDMDLVTFGAINPETEPMAMGGGDRVNVIQGQRSGGAPRWYTVQAGDTVDTIAAKFNLRLGRLLAANENILPAEYRPGMRIRVPAARE